MSRNSRTSRFTRMLRKLSVSAFVIATFIIYAIHERLAGPQDLPVAGAQPVIAPPQQTQAAPPATAAPLAVAPTDVPATAVPTTPPTAPPTDAPTAVPTDIPTARPTEVPATAVPPTVAPAGPVLAGYRDGVYTGPEVDAYYGIVKVQATIAQGKLTDVQFVEYPNDRRTSIRINRVAMPYLQQEAIQAQSANVDVISGATLTSEAFVESLRAALHGAQTNA